MNVLLIYVPMLFSSCKLTISESEIRMVTVSEKVDCSTNEPPVRFNTTEGDVSEFCKDTEVMLKVAIVIGSSKLRRISCVSRLS